MSIQDARGSLDNEPVKVVRPDRFAKRFAKSMQEIEDERFLDQDLFLGTFELANPATQKMRGDDPPAERRDEQCNQKSRPHQWANLFRCRLVMQILL